MKSLYFILFSLMFLPFSYSQDPILKVGLIADPQYANKPTQGIRYYKESLWKLEEAIDTFNCKNVDIVQSLGDIIDGKWNSYDDILPIYNKLNPDIKSYQLLGNHDFSVDSTHLSGLLEKLSMPDYYYSYSEKDWRFIVLDATDYSYFSNPLHHHDINKVNSYYENTTGESNKRLWNGAIGKEQQAWLKQELDSANLLNQKIILFSHLPIRPKRNSHNLWNDYEIVDIVENNSNVVAYINGHNHSGNYIFKNGIHYITISGMVDTMTNSYGILEIYKDKLILRGYGNQNTFLHLEID